MHGDLGCVTGDDAVICISHSGNTQELVHAMAHVQQRSPRPTVLSIVGAADEAGTPRDSKLAAISDAVLSYPIDREPCPCPAACTHHAEPRRTACRCASNLLAAIGIPGVSDSGGWQARRRSPLAARRRAAWSGRR